VRYYDFLRRYESLYRANRPHAEVLLLFPRSRVHEGDIGAVGRFKELGKRLLDAHVLFDVLPDDRVSRSRPVPFSRPTGSSRPSDGRGVRGEGYWSAVDGYVTVVDPSQTTITASNVLQRLASGLSRFEVPATVRVSASRPADGHELTLHFVNYNREEPADKKNPVNGIKNEKPIAAPASQVDLALDKKQRARQIEFLTPEAEQPRELEFEQAGARLRFGVPEFLVYGVVRVQLSN